MSTEKKSDDEIAELYEAKTLLDNIEKESLAVAPKDFMGEEKKGSIPETQIIAIIANLSNMFAAPEKSVFLAIELLFLKGAASASTPNNLFVTVRHDGGIMSVSKYDLLYAYQRETGNPYLRRLAESLNNQISKFAEANGLDGDLSKQINSRLVASGEPALTQKQKSWCSSFNQFNNTLEKDTDLNIVAKLLAIDYQVKFKKREQKKAIKRPTPRATGKPTKRAKLFKKGNAGTNP